MFFFIKMWETTYQNFKCEGGNISFKSINVQDEIGSCRWEFLLRIDNCACTSIWYTSIYRKLRHTNSLGFYKYEFISFF